MARRYTSPRKLERACRYKWFGAWDWIVNSALSLAGSPVIEVGPGEAAVDLHVHTLFSRCSISRPDRIIERAAALGLRGVGMLDHNRPGAAREAELCLDEMKLSGVIPEDFVVIPGMEISSTQGHIGGLFVRETLPGDIPPDQVVKHIHEAGGLAVAVHPYHSTGVGDAVFDLDFDAVEICCGSVFNREQCRRNAALADDPRLASIAKLGASDAHYIRGIGSCYSVFSIPTLIPEAIRSAILECRVTARESSHCRRIQRALGPVSKLA